MAGERSVCLVCNSAAGTTPVSIHSNLASKTGTIHGRLCEVVGPQDLAEACQVSQVLCAGCLRLLLNIVYFEYRVVVLRDKFRITFHKGAESRRVGLGGSHFKCNSLSTTKEEEFEVDAGELPVDSHGFPETLAAQLTFPSAQELSDLLPRHCLEGGEELENFQSQNGRDSENNGLKWPDISVKSGSISPVEGQSTTKLDGEGVAEDVEGSSTLGDALSNAEGEESICVIPDLDDMALVETPVLHFTAGDGVRSNTRQPKNTKQAGARRRKKATKRLAKADGEDDGAEWEHMEVTGKADQGGAGVKCELCGAVFSSAGQLGQHRGQIHPSAYPHACHTCPHARYREKAKLTQHLRRIHHLVTHICPGCDHKAGSQNSLDQHIISEHPTSRYYQCHICNKAFRTHRYLHFVHIKRCHMGLPVKYSCDKCNKGFVDKSSFENHKVTHSTERNFTCEFCGAAFCTPYALKVHVNTHTQEKKYSCTDCGAAFLRLCNLSAHRKRFHGCSDMRLVCEVCGLATTTQRDLRRHQLATHAKEKPFTCHICHRSYTAKESLNTHLRTHTGEKPYKCSCGKAFYKRDVLRRHQRCVHEGEPPHQPPMDSQASQATVQVGQEDLQAGHMVVITLHECDSHDSEPQACDPMAVYSVQDTPCLEQVLVATSTSDGNPNHQPPLIANTLAGGGAGALQLDTLSTGQLSLSTPVLLTTLTTTTTSTPTPTLPHSAFTTQNTLTNLVPAAPVSAPHLLQLPLPDLHTTTTTTTPTVSFVASWPPPSL